MIRFSLDTTIVNCVVVTLGPCFAFELRFGPSLFLLKRTFSLSLFTKWFIFLTQLFLDRVSHENFAQGRILTIQTYFPCRKIQRRRGRGGGGDFSPLLGQEWQWPWWAWRPAGRQVIIAYCVHVEHGLSCIYRILSRSHFNGKSYSCSLFVLILSQYLLLFFLFLFSHLDRLCKTWARQTRRRTRSSTTTYTTSTSRPTPPRGSKRRSTTTSDAWEVSETRASERETWK